MTLRRDYGEAEARMTDPAVPAEWYVLVRRDDTETINQVTYGGLSIGQWLEESLGPGHDVVKVLATNYEARGIGHARP